MTGPLLCVLYALLNLVLFCVLLLVVWKVLAWALVTFAPTLVIDGRIWQGLGLIVFLLVLIWIVQAFHSGGLCRTGWVWMS